MSKKVKIEFECNISKMNTFNSLVKTKPLVCMSDSEKIRHILHRIEVLEFEVKVLNSKLKERKTKLK